jgi:ankyrin repeat protein
LDESTKCATIKDKDGNMALHSACECQKPSSKVILRLIQANPKALEKRDKEKNLPLHSALELGDVIEPDVIKVMIDMYPGAVKIKDIEKNTPLHSAVENMRKFASAVVDMLLKADPGNYAVKQRDAEGNLAIHSACEHPRPTNDVILRLMELYPGGLKQKDKDGNLAIHSACENNAPNDKVILKMMELYPGSLKIKDKDGNLPIHSISENNRVYVCLRFNPIFFGLKQKDKEDKDGNLPLTDNDIEALIEYLFTDNEITEPYQLENVKQAAIKKFGSEAKLQVAMHITENTKEMENRDKVILKMIDLYPDSLRRKDKDGNTPLHSFIENPSQINNREKVIGVMVKEYEGALAEKDRDKNLPIHSALAQGKKISIEGIKALLVNQETLLVKNARGNIPFHQAFNMAGKKLDDKANAILNANPSAMLISDRNCYGNYCYFLHWAIGTKKKRFA